MKRLLKILLGALAALLGLLVLAGGLIGSLFDPNDYRADIERLAKEQANIELRIGGDIGWSWFPWFGIELNELSINTLAAVDKPLALVGNKPLASEKNKPLAPEQGKPLAALGQVRLSVRILPLLAGQIEVGALTLKQVQAHLQRDKQGRGNWEALMAANGAADPTKADAAKADGSAALSDATEDGSVNDAGAKGAGKPLQLNIASINVEDLVASYEDLQTGQVFEVVDLDFSSRDIQLNQAFPFVLNAELLSQAPAARLRLSLSAEMTAELSQLRFDLAAIDLSLHASLPDQPLEARLRMASEARLNVQQQFYQLAVAELLLDAEAPGIVPKPLTVKLAFDAEANLAEEDISLTGLVVDAQGLTAKADLNLLNYTQGLQLDGTLKVLPVNLKQLMENLGLAEINTQNPEMLQELRAQMRFQGPANSIGIKDLRLGLDETEFKGFASYGIDNGAIRFELNGNQLDLDAYLPPATEQLAATETPKANQAAAADSSHPEPGPETDLIPVELVRGLDVHGKLGLKKLKAQKLNIEDVQLFTTAKQGLVQLHYFKADLYEGNVLATARLDARQLPLSYQVHKEINQVQVLPMLMDGAELDLLEGAVNFRGDFTTQGNRISKLIAGLNGDAQFDFAAGRLKINLLAPVCKAFATLNQSPFDASVVPEYTAFKDFSGRLIVKDGVLNNEQLVASMAGIELQGDGEVNLNTADFLYRLALVVNGDTSQQGCAVNARYQNFPWPVDCQGNYSTQPLDLRCGADEQRFRQAIKDLAQAELKRSLAEKKQKNQKKVQDKIKKKQKKLEEELKGRFKF